MSSLLRKFHSKGNAPSSSSSSNNSIHPTKLSLKSSSYRCANSEDIISAEKSFPSAREANLQDKTKVQDRSSHKLHDLLDIIFSLLRQYHLSVSKDKIPLLSKLITEYLSLQDEGQICHDIGNLSKFRTDTKLNQPKECIQKRKNNSSTENQSNRNDPSMNQQSITPGSISANDKITILLTMADNIHHLSRWIKDCLINCPDHKQNFPLLKKLLKFLRCLLWTKLIRKKLLECDFNSVIMKSFFMPECMVDISLLKDVYYILLHLCYDLEHIIAFTTINFESGRKKENFINIIMRYLVGITDPELQYIILGTIQSICAKKEGRIALLSQSAIIESEKNDLFPDKQSSNEPLASIINDESTSIPPKNSTMINKYVYILSSFLGETQTSKVKTRALSVIHNLSADEKTIFTLRQSNVINVIMNILWYHHGKHMALSSSLLDEKPITVFTPDNYSKYENFSASTVYEFPGARSKENSNEINIDPIIGDKDRDNTTANPILSRKKEKNSQTKNNFIHSNNQKNVQREANCLDKNMNVDHHSIQNIFLPSRNDIEKSQEGEQIIAALGIIQNMSREKTSRSIFLEKFDAIKPLTVFLSSSEVSYQTSAAGAIYNLLSYDDIFENSKKDPQFTEQGDSDSDNVENKKQEVNKKKDHTQEEKIVQPEEKTNENQSQFLHRKDLLESTLSDLILLGMVADVLTFDQ